MNIFESLNHNINKVLDENLKDNMEKCYSNTSNLTNIELELANKLDAIEEFTVDRFEGDFVILENRKTGEMLDIDKNKISENLKEGDILKRINGKFYINELETKQVSDRIKHKMNNLWN